MNTKICEKFGKNLKSIRKAKGYTQEALAAKVGIHETYVGKIESGKSNISLKMIYRISRALDIKLVEMFDFD